MPPPAALAGRRRQNPVNTTYGRRGPQRITAIENSQVSRPLGRIEEEYKAEEENEPVSS